MNQVSGRGTIVKTLIATIGLLCAFGFACAATKHVTSAIADLDGNGRKEKVWITTVKNVKSQLEHSILHVDKADIEISAEHVYGLVIVDVERSDPYKEIDVSTNSGGDPTGHKIYWFDGKSIRQMANLIWKPDYKGNGIVLGQNWMIITDKYVLDKKSRKLVLVPQEMYYIGKQHKVLRGFPIYYSRQSKSVVANVERNSTVIVLAYVPSPPGTDPKRHDVMQDWFLIKTQSGLLGWVRLQTLSRYVEGMQGAG